jgi:hypothetical protein
MAETVEAFACPKCGKIIEYGTHPCPFCGMPITWEGFTPPVREQVALTDAATERIGQVFPLTELPARGIETVRTPVVEEVTAVVAGSMNGQSESTAAFQQTEFSQDETFAMSSAQPSTTVAKISVSSTYPPLLQTAAFPSQQDEASLTSRIEIPPAPQIEVLSASQVRLEPAPQAETVRASWATQAASVSDPILNAPAPASDSVPLPAPAPAPTLTLASVSESIFAPDTVSSPVSIPVQTPAPAPLSVEALTPAPALNFVLDQTLDQAPASDSASNSVVVSDPAPDLAPDPTPTPVGTPNDHPPAPTPTPY